MRNRRIVSHLSKRLALILSTILLIIAFGGGTKLSAQSLSGSLTGVVSDPTGATVSGADVVLTDVDKGYTFTSISDADGRYIIRNLNPGNYRLKVRAQGFEAYSLSGIVIAVNENTSSNVVLKVGNATETVNVVSEAPLMQTEDAILGATFNREFVNDLPLVGRDVLTLTYLTPGVTPAQGATLNAAGGSEGNDLNFVSNGQRNATAALFVDGVITSQGDPNPGALRPLYIPTVDAVQEFKVEQGIIRADTGFSGGSVINIVTRSGSNEIHGTVYDFDQNNSFNANSYSNNHYHVKNRPSNTNTFGTVVGGPIKKDKTFFFLVYNGGWSRNSSSSTMWVPSAAERAGDFGEICQSGFDGTGRCLDTSDATNFGQLWDPYTSMIVNGDVTSQAFIPYNNLATYVSPGPPAAELSSVTLPPGLGNIIDPVSKLIVNTAFPAPNIPNAATNAANYYSVTAGHSAGEEIDLRLDQRFTQKDNLIGKFAYEWGNSNLPGCLTGVWDPCSNGPNTGYTYQVALNYSRAISPHTLLQLQGGVIRNNDISPGVASQYPDFDPVTTLGMPSYIDSTGYKAAPYISIAGAGSVGAIGSKTWAIWNIGFETWQLGGNLDLVRGRHDIKVGADWRVQRENFFEPGVPAGMFGYSNTGTALDATSGVGGGNSLASLMVGGPLSGGANYQMSTQGNTQNPDYDIYLQDTWHITPKLTLDLGVRYEIQVPETESSNRIVWFDPNAPSPLAGYSSEFPNLKGAVDFAGNLSGPRTPINTSYNNIQPRIGFAYQLDHATVVRGGYGIFYLPSAGAASGIPSGNSSGWMSYTGQSSYEYNAGNAYDGATPVARLSNPFPGGILQPFGINQSPLAFVGSGDGTPLAIRTNSNVPYQQTWTLGVQRDLPLRSLLNVYYIGTKGTHLYNSAADDLDHLPASVESMTPTQIANLVNNFVPNPFYNAPVPQGCKSWNDTCYSTWPQYFTMLPYPQFDQLITLTTPFGSSIYHSLQAQFQKRLSVGLQLQASYTWSKSIDDTSVVSGSTAYLSGGSNPQAVDPNNLKLERSVSGFDVPQSLTFAYTYALPYGHGRQFGSTANHLMDAVLGGWNTSGMFAFQSGFPLSISQQNGTPIPTYYAIRPTINGVLKKSSSFKKPGDNYFANPSVVSSTPDYTAPSKTVGNVPRFSSSVRAPGINTASIGISKSFDLESLRQGARFELRIESFNAFNHPQFYAPNSTEDSGQFGVVNVGQQNSPRQVQFGGKIYF